MEAGTDMKEKILKPSVILPTAIGLMIGALLFAMGIVSDAPGACLIGIVVAFLLLALSARNTGVVPKGYLLPIVLMCFGLGGVLLSIGWFLDLEFDSAPQFPVAALCVGIVLLCVGLLTLRKVRRNV
jgi:hypothetical protein